MIPSPASLPLAFDPTGLFRLGLVCFLAGGAHSALLWLGHRREPGLGHVLAATALQGLGLLLYLAQPWPGGLLAPASLLLAAAGYGLWAFRRYAGLPVRMNRWAWLALGAWVLVALAFVAMGYRWVPGLVRPVAVAVLALGISRELGHLSRPGGGKAPQVCAGLAVALALAALGAGAAAAFPPADPGLQAPQARAWFFFLCLAAHLVFTLLLAQVQGQRIQLRLDRLTGIDPVTGLASAQGFRECLVRAAGRSLRTGRPTSVLVLELDGFEAMLERHGPAPLGHILEAFAQTMNRTLREADLCGRLEGCRFAALLHHTQPFEALLAGERLRATWENLTLTLGAGRFQPSLSGGVASTLEPIQAADDLLALAAGRAAAARTAGGNRVEGEG